MAPKVSPGNRHKRGFSGSYGCCPGVSWLVIGIGVWLGVRFSRAGRGDAHLCAVCTASLYDLVEVFARVVGAVSEVD